MFCTVLYFQAASDSHNLCQVLSHVLDSKYGHVLQGHRKTRRLVVIERCITTCHMVKVDSRRGSEFTGYGSSMVSSGQG